MERLVLPSFCEGQISKDVQKRRHCGEFRSAPLQSNGTAGCLGFFLGPIGLWYKGHWAAGFAWIAMTVILMLATGGAGIVLAPFLSEWPFMPTKPNPKDSSPHTANKMMPPVITQVRSTGISLVATSDGRDVHLTTFRETLWKQGLVYLPAPFTDQCLPMPCFNDPDDDESFMDYIDRCILDHQIAA